MGEIKSTGVTLPNKIALAIAFITITAGLLVIIGWFADIELLKSVLPGLVAMKFNTALVFILTGLSLLSKERRWIATSSSAFAEVITLITLVQYLFNVDTGLDQFFIAEPAGATLTVHLGRMAISTAICFFLLNFALLWHVWNQKYCDLVAQVSAGLTFLFAYQSLVGYILGVKILLIWGHSFTAMAINTAGPFILLSIGLFLNTPRSTLMTIMMSPSAAGIVVRRFLITIIVLPIFLAWIDNYLFAKGLATHENSNFLSAIASVIWMFILLWVTVRYLHGMDIQKRRIRDLLDATGQVAKVGGWDLDVLSQKLEWTSEIYRIYEVPDTFQPTVATAIDFYTEESKQLITQAVDMAIKQGTSFDLDGQIRTGKNNLVWVNAKGEAWQENGITVRVFGIFQDVTKIKLAEVEKNQMQALLLHSAKLASIGTLAAGVGHEINNPLTIIKGNLSFILDSLQKEDKDKGRPVIPILQKVEAAVDRIATIVNRLRNFGRTDDDSIGVINLHSVIQDTLFFIETIYQNAGIQIKTAYLCPNPVIMGNVGKIQQMLLKNLGRIRHLSTDRPPLNGNFLTHLCPVILVIS